MMNIQMVDLRSQYEKIKSEIDQAVLDCMQSTLFINGPQVKEFSQALGKYLQAFAIPCANGTDALQIALMSLDLKPGDEVIVPSFTYVASAEVIGLLGLIPVMVDVDSDSFNITPALIEEAITPKTRAIIPVHLFGQCAEMAPIKSLADNHNIYIVEDTAQAIGADYLFPDGKSVKAGTIGTIGCTSFFPSKNLGCYGDGGALYTTNKSLADKIQMIANHGQFEKYVHKYIGINSRLDSIQAAILQVKLRLLDTYTAARQQAAKRYTEMLNSVEGVVPPARVPFSSHVYHQYTIKVRDGKRDQLRQFLQSKQIPSMVYYPVPLNKQEAYASIGKTCGDLLVTDELCSTVLSLPMHTELTLDQQEYIVKSIKDFFQK